MISEQTEIESLPCDSAPYSEAIAELTWVASARILAARFTRAHPAATAMAPRM